jgi:hypothetical protein
MAILKSAAEAENMVKQILADRATERTDLEGLIIKDDIAITEADGAMDQATAAGDLKAYQKAKGEKQNAEDSKEMHTKRLNALKKKPLISPADYEKAVSAIYTDFAALEDHTKQQLAKLSDEMNVAAVDLTEAMNHANKVLHSLQHDIYRDADRERISKDGPFTSTSKQEIDRWDAIRWGKAGVTHYQYTEYTGRKVE